MNIDVKSRQTRERIILVIYIIYTFVMTAVAQYFHWEGWITPLILAALAFCIGLSLKQAKTYEFRAVVTTLMMWMNLSIYISHSKYFTGTFSTMTAMIVLLSIYGIPKLSCIGAVVYTLHLLCHFLILKDLDPGFGQEGVPVLLRIASVYVVFYVTYGMIKTQASGNAALLEHIEAVRRAEQSKDDFMANMSHEIRTPINTVCGISEMVLREDLPEAAREGVYDIQTAGRQLLSLVSDILDFSELSSGKMEIVPDTYNITSMINDILNMAVAKLEGKNIELIVDCDAHIPIGLVGDEQKIRRAVLNVLDNAIKFTEEGGILLSVSFREEDYGGNLVITVQDTGIGMTEDMQENLFQSFSQMDTKRNRKVSGMGIGLSITKVIVSRMGGFVSVNSVYGQGTSVQLVFPQEVSRPEPVVSLREPDECRVMLYLGMEKYHHALVRDGYAQCIRRMVERLGMYYRHVQSLAECKRRMEQEEFTHLFVAWTEYCEDRAYFEALSKKMSVVLVLDRDHKESIMGSRLLCVYKPFYVLTIASVLNGHYVEHIGRAARGNLRFTAPDARVLVVDDNLMNLRVVEGLLRPYQLRVFTAESGQEALDRLETERVDFVFMDHMMPEMDGIETFHRIRKKPGSYFQNVPVVALTANAIGGAREMFLQEGFADYISKPIEISALERVLYKFIPEEKLLRTGDAEQSISSPAADDKIAQENARPGQTAEEPERSAGTEPFAFDGFDGIDVTTGLHYCGGSWEDYTEIIRIYYESGQKKKKDILTCYEAENWKDYTTYVHAVKSTSLNIGAVHLSELAKALEAAGKEHDLAYLLAHTEEMLAEYERVLAAIGAEPAIIPDGAGEPAQASAEDLEEIDRETLAKWLDQIKQQLQEFDSDGALGSLQEASGFAFRGEPLAGMFSGLRRKLEDFDVIGAQEEFTGLKEQLHE